ncbi:MFS transporter [Streptomyces sp. NPDC096354]|uniref:MFS transporter n=1 Tax=Streptomyces sp. NPDC096354 TaxID=3366088 RepID=UPI0037F13CCF
MSTTELPVTRIDSKLRKNRDWLKIWTGGTALTLGDQIFATSLTLWVGAVLSDGESWGPTAMSGVLLAQAIPPILISVIAGTFVDRWNKRHVMIVASAISALTCAALLVAVSLAIPTAPLLATVCCAVFLLAAAQQFFNPANISTLYDVVPVNQRTEAVGKLLASTQVILMIGPPLAAPLLFGLGMQGSIVVDLASFALACTLAWRLRVKLSLSESASRGNLATDFLNALRFIRRMKILRLSLGTFFFFSLCASSTTAVSYFYITERLHCSPAAVGAFGTVLGIGAMVGSYGARKKIAQDRSHHAYAAGLVLFGVLSGLYSKMESISIGGVVYFLWGMAYGIIAYSLEAIAATSVPQRLIGRVSSLIAPMQGIAAVIGLLVGSYFAHQGVAGASIGFSALSVDPLRGVYRLVCLITVAAGCYAALRFRDTSLHHAEVEHAGEAEVEGHSIAMDTVGTKDVEWNIRKPFLL